MNEKEAIEKLEELSHYCALKNIDREDDIFGWFVVAIQVIENLLESQKEEIKILTKSSDKWFAKKIKQDEEFTKERNKLNNIIDTLITALAEERGTDEDEIREVFLNE